MSVFGKILMGAVALPLSIGFGAAVEARQAAPAVKPDADALSALNRMGEALRSLPAFTVTADVTTEQVLDSGQKLQYGGDLKIEAQRPNGFKIYMNFDHKKREIYYDGKSVTLFAPKVGYYASVPAPATIGATIATIQDKYGVEIPLADLFQLGVDPTLTARIQSGFHVGPEQVRGLACEHYAFRQEAADWQVWIRADGAALPCKMVITTTQDEAQPQYVVFMTWEAKAPAQAAYTFAPPANAHRITVAELSATGTK